MKNYAPYIPADACIKAVVTLSGLTEDELKATKVDNKTSMFRNLLCYLLYVHAWMTGKELGEFMGRHRSSVARAAASAHNKLPEAFINIAINQALVFKRGDHD